jgi:hypothetical protein
MAVAVAGKKKAVGKKPEVVDKTTVVVVGKKTKTVVEAAVEAAVGQKTEAVGKKTAVVETTMMSPGEVGVRKGERHLRAVTKELH